MFLFHMNCNIKKIKNLRVHETSPFIGDAGVFTDSVLKFSSATRW